MAVDQCNEIATNSSFGNEAWLEGHHDRENIPQTGILRLSQKNILSKLHAILNLIYAILAATPDAPNFLEKLRGS
jgi:hypothetical protein